MSILCDEKEFCSFIGTARRIWFHRNDALHGGPFLHPSVLVQQASKVRKEFVEANEQAQVVFPRTTADMTQWSPLPQG